MSDWTIESLVAALRARRISAVEITDECLARIDRLNPVLRAFITVDADGARRAAKERDGELAAGRARGPLHGVPMAWKDLCASPGLPTSCGTRTRDYFVSERPCTAVARLVAAGAITLGKTNMTELALGPFGDNAHHGHVQNPWRNGHCSGGSSSGSGSAVAAGLALGALGSDTGGSIRLPAACCGIVGLKPTYGRVSRAGAMALSWSNDHLGPMTRTVRDAALMLGIIAGWDAADATTSRRPVPDYLRGIDGGIRGLRIGVPASYYFDDVNAEVVAAVREAARQLGALGAHVSEVRVPDPMPLGEITGVISRAESVTIHERLLRERPQDIQPVVRTRLEFDSRAGTGDRRRHDGRRRRHHQEDGALLASHAALQRAGTPGIVLALRVFDPGTATGARDRRPALRRGDGTARRTSIRAGRGLGQPASRHRVTAPPRTHRTLIVIPRGV
ncbi:MAG: Asp-tRNA(Asn)/Glu-tRNA(Gln) amidotransferase GatCAB subunit A [Candidatus Rokuibacteriota bacterium]|nr:MAG: Asp-tRNA(Asn)/Glu-tRNA(Gln) amidotransferase GatCAB subunit A [Candidatus Rokubacteria bacterium]